MATIGEIIGWRSKEVYRYLYERFLKPRKKKTTAPADGIVKERKRPAEILTFDQLRRMMGDTGPRQFLKEKGSKRK